MPCLIPDLPWKPAPIRQHAVLRPNVTFSSMLGLHSELRQKPSCTVWSTTGTYLPYRVMEGVCGVLNATSTFFVANNSKQLAVQKKITSNKVRKSILYQVSKFQFLCRKGQLPCTKDFCPSHMPSYEIRPFTGHFGKLTTW